jgi:hypothetical protein
MPDIPKTQNSQDRSRSTRRPKSWRDDLPIHPAAELFPLMPPDELRALGENTKKNGFTSSSVLWRPHPQAPVQLLDGRNRLDAIEIATGHHVEVVVKDDKWIIDAGVWISDKVIVLDNSVDPYAYVISANIHRRHLTAKQRRELIAKLIKAQPEKSDRQIAETVKASHHTVGAVRVDMERRGQVAHVAARTDTKGRQQPAKRVRDYAFPQLHRRTKLGDETVDKIKGTTLDSAEEMDELVMLNRGAPPGEQTETVKQLVADAVAGKDVSAIAIGRGTAPKLVMAWRKRMTASWLLATKEERRKLITRLMSDDDIAPNSSSEADRLRAHNEELARENHRLTRESLALRSEVDELKLENARLRAQLLAPTDHGDSDGDGIPDFLDRTRGGAGPFGSTP